MINNKGSSTAGPQNCVDKNNWEREQSDLWDGPNVLLLMLDALDVEIISETGFVTIAAPMDVKCSVDSATKLSKSQYFKVELLDENIWRISLDRFEYPFVDDSKMIPWTVENRKEAPTRKAEEWAEMIIENSNYHHNKVKS